MVKIHFRNGKTVCFPTYEKGCHLFYECIDFNQAVELNTILVDLGNKAFVVENELGYFVQVKK